MKSKKIKHICIVSILASIALIIYRSIFLIQNLLIDPSFQSYSESFNNNQFVFNIILGCTFVAIFIASLIIIKPENVNTKYVVSTNKITRISSLIETLVGSLLFMFLLFTTLFYRDSLFIVKIINLIFFVLSVIYFALHFFESKLSVSFSFFPELWILTLLIISYFDKIYIMKNPTRILGNIAYACILLTFLFLVKTKIGNNTSKLQFSFALSSLVVVSAYVIPNLISIFLWFGKAETYIFVSELFMLPLVVHCYLSYFSNYFKKSIDN